MCIRDRHPCVHVVQVVLFGDHGDQLITQDKGNDDTSDGAVSYTHLDVYKRQPLLISCFGIRTVYAGLTIPSHGEIPFAPCHIRMEL